MRILFLLFGMAAVLCAAGIKEGVLINHHKFDFVNEVYNEYGERGVTLKIYRHGADREASPLYTFTLESTWGGCRDKTVEKGAYEINGSKILFFTHWDRVGSVDNAPRGDRVAVYRIDDNGSIVRESARLYVERYARGYDRESGMQYLFSRPSTQEEREALQKYIDGVEHAFQGKFVQGKTAKLLHDQVADALDRKYRNLWR